MMFIKEQKSFANTHNKQTTTAKRKKKEKERRKEKEKASKIIVKLLYRFYIQSTSRHPLTDD